MNEVARIVEQGPCVLLLCHPSKVGNSLFPRGGSAIIGAVDTNLTLVADRGVTTLHHNKIRDRPFDEIKFAFETVPLRTPTPEGRIEYSVVPRVLTDQEAHDHKASEGLPPELQALFDDMVAYPDSTLAARAVRLGYDPKDRGKMSRMVKRLRAIRPEF